MMQRKFPSSYKSLAHFDFPYPGEPGDGLRDEIGILEWERVGGVAFVGTEPPNDGVVADTPWKGYRCVSSEPGKYIQAANAQGIFDFSSGGTYEADFFVRPTSANPGNIFSLRDGGGDIFSLALAAGSTGRLTLTSSALGLSLTSSPSLTLTLNTFQHIVIRIAGGAASVFVDGTQFVSGSMTGDVTLLATYVQLGGFTGQIDEFRFRHAAGAGPPTIPEAQYQGTVNIKEAGGFGDGSYGNVPISTNSQINSYAIITAIDNAARQVTIGTQANGIYGGFSPSQEIMIHVSHFKGTDKTLLGHWHFRRIQSVNGSTLTLDKALSEGTQITDAATGAYYIQAITVPNYDNLTVTATISPRAWDTASGGGIVALRCSGSLNLAGGKIITAGKGVRNQDHGFNLSHTGILERFINNGNVFIAARHVSGSAEARIGNDSDGSLGGGDGGNGGDGNYNGASGNAGAVGKGAAGGAGGGSAVTSGGGGGPNNGGSGGKDAASGGGREYSPPNVIILSSTLALDRSTVSVGGYGAGGGGYGGSTPGAGGAAGGGGNGGDCGAHNGAGGGGAIDGNAGLNGGYDGTGAANPGSHSGGGTGGGAGGAGRGGRGGGNGGSGYGGGGGGGAAIADSYGSSGGGGGGGSDAGFAYIAASELLAA